VWDRRFGFLNKVLTTPVGRGAIVMGKIFSSVIRSLVQAGLVLVIALILALSTAGSPLLSNLGALGIIGTFSGLFLMTLGLSAVAPCRVSSNLLILSY
jgi:ABC-2 type transport system permease protein